MEGTCPGSFPPSSFSSDCLLSPPRPTRPLHTRGRWPNMDPTKVPWSCKEPGRGGETPGMLCVAPTANAKCQGRGCQQPTWVSPSKECSTSFVCQTCCLLFNSTVALHNSQDNMCCTRLVDSPHSSDPLSTAMYQITLTVYCCLPCTVLLCCSGQ